MDGKEKYWKKLVKSLRQKNKEIKEKAETQIDELYRQIGKLKVERDFLVGRSVQLGLPTDKSW
jgi:hypothetical protein